MHTSDVLYKAMDDNGIPRTPGQDVSNPGDGNPPGAPEVPILSCQKETSNAVISISDGSPENDSHSLRAELAAAHGTITDLNGIVANLRLKVLQLENEANSGMI